MLFAAADMQRHLPFLSNFDFCISPQRSILAMCPILRCETKGRVTPNAGVRNPRAAPVSHDTDNTVPLRPVPCAFPMQSGRTCIAPCRAVPCDGMWRQHVTERIPLHPRTTPAQRWSTLLPAHVGHVDPWLTVPGPNQVLWTAKSCWSAD